MAQRSPESDKPAGRGVVLTLAAVAAGLWLGQSTVSAIDPFYRGSAADGGSYTVRGWAGANAIPAPEPEPDPVPTRYAANPYVFPAVIVERSLEPAASSLERPDETQPPAPDDAAGASGWSDYECVDCDKAPAAEDRAASQDDYVIAGRDCGDGWSRSGDCRDLMEDDGSWQAEF